MQQEIQRKDMQSRLTSLSNDTESCFSNGTGAPADKFYSKVRWRWRQREGDSIESDEREKRTEREESERVCTCDEREGVRVYPVSAVVVLPPITSNQRRATPYLTHWKCPQRAYYPQQTPCLVENGLTVKVVDKTTATGCNGSRNR